MNSGMKHFAIYKLSFLVKLPQEFNKAQLKRRWFGIIIMLLALVCHKLSNFILFLSFDSELI